jgi:NADH:ubiquinone oxidoreductase subunit 3 (subunit A)
MGNIVLLCFIQNVFLFCAIFWLLTWVAEWFYQKKDQVSKKQFYECGFKSISDLNIQINLNFSLVCIFLILYDVEFVFLFPFLFNFLIATSVSFYIFIFFMFILVLSLVYDLSHAALNVTL